jgi:hypothetical protein
MAQISAKVQKSSIWSNSTMAQILTESSTGHLKAFYGVRLCEYLEFKRVQFAHLISLFYALATGRCIMATYKVERRVLDDNGLVWGFAVSKDGAVHQYSDADVRKFLSGGKVIIGLRLDKNGGFVGANGVKLGQLPRERRLVVAPSASQPSTVGKTVAVAPSADLSKTQTASALVDSKQIAACRHLYRKLQQWLDYDGNGIALLHGPRAVGKTYMLETNICRDYKSAKYILCTPETDTEELEKLIKSGNYQILMLDEITSIPRYDMFLKKLGGWELGNCKVILSGSSAWHLSIAGNSALGGHSDSFYLGYPTFIEHLAFAGKISDKYDKKDLKLYAPTANDFDDFLNQTEFVKRGLSVKITDNYSKSIASDVKIAERQPVYRESYSGVTDAHIEILLALISLNLRDVYKVKLLSTGAIAETYKEYIKSPTIEQLLSADVSQYADKFNKLTLLEKCRALRWLVDSGLVFLNPTIRLSADDEYIAVPKLWDLTCRLDTMIERYDGCEQIEIEAVRRDILAFNGVFGQMNIACASPLMLMSQLKSWFNEDRIQFRGKYDFLLGDLLELYVACVAMQKPSLTSGNRPSFVVPKIRTVRGDCDVYCEKLGMLCEVTLQHKEANRVHLSEVLPDQKLNRILCASDDVRGGKRTQGGVEYRVVQYPQFCARFDLA